MFACVTIPFTFSCCRFALQQVLAFNDLQALHLAACGWFQDGAMQIRHICVRMIELVTC
jgi:hypothetical protein